MSWWHYLFGLGGRISRLRYWQFALLSVVFVLIAAAVAAPYVAIEHPDASDPSKPLSPLAIATFAAAGIVVFAFAFATFAVFVKRLHDRNKSAWWLLIFAAGPPVLARIADGNLPSDVVLPPWATLTAAVLAMIVNLWGFIEIALLRGTRGANRYGPDPLAGR